MAQYDAVEQWGSPVSNRSSNPKTALSLLNDATYMVSMNDFAPSTHILLDFYGGEHLTDAAALRDAILKAADAAGSTVLSCDLHEFGDDAGVTGVAILAESHMSIHTWPEIDYAAIDIFMCGKADAEKAAKKLEELLKPKRTEITRVARGRLGQPSED